MKNESSHEVPLEGLDERGRTLLSHLSSMVLRREKLAELERQACIGSASTEGRVFERLRELREENKNSRAMYSLSVFPPALWSEKRLAEFFLPEARRNIARAAALAKSIESRGGGTLRPETRLGLQKINRGAVPNLQFRFSKPLYTAIERAKAISKQLSVTSMLKAALGRSGSLQDITLRERQFIERNGGSKLPRGCDDKSESLSIWDNICYVPGCEVETEVSSEELMAIDEIVAMSLVSRLSIEDMRFDITAPYEFVLQ